MPIGDAFSSGHLVPSHLGIAYVLLVETIDFYRTCRYFSGLPTSNIRSSGSVVVKLLACGAEDRDSIPGLAATISEIGYLLLQSRDMAERSLKRLKSSKQQTTTNNTSNIPRYFLDVDWHSE